jgi:ubiquinone/menaquinone biosynthesis C-methylase UbiE
MDKTAEREQTYIQSAEIRNGKIHAKNTDRQVEDVYGVAYNLGCGKKKWDGWINVDLHSDISDIKCDLRKLEIGSDSADAVAAIHVLEHFYEYEVFDVLTEWKRVLKPNGKMILELPCMDKVFAYIHNCVVTKTPLMPFMSLYALYGDPRHKEPAMCHRWGWFEVPLKQMLESVGMERIEFKEPNYHFPFRDMRIECYKGS